VSVSPFGFTVPFNVAEVALTEDAGSVTAVGKVKLKVVIFTSGSELPEA
jgi:hypothetical protein